MMLVQATSFPYTNYTRFLFKRQLRKEDNLEDEVCDIIENLNNNNETKKKVRAKGKGNPVANKS